METQSRGFPLAALFLLIAVCGFIASAVSIADTGSKTKNASDIVSVMLVLGLIGGGLLGAFYPKRFRGILVGAGTGVVIGLGAGAAESTKGSALQLWVAALVVSAAILGFAAMVRIFKRRPEEVGE